jgi:hypothetical protein
MSTVRRTQRSRAGYALLLGVSAHLEGRDGVASHPVAFMRTSQGGLHMSHPLFYARVDIDEKTSTKTLRDLREFVRAKGMASVESLTTDELLSMLDELIHLRWQRDALQKRGTELVLDNQKRRRDGLLVEELQRDATRQKEHLLLIERVALKLWDALNDEADAGAASFLAEDECYVLEGIPPQGKP